MKTPAPILLLWSLAFSGLAIAEVPKKAPASRYSGLVTNSPFTTKPEVVGPTVADNILNDYGLIGVSPLGGDRYRATIVNKKKPDEPRIYLETGTVVSGFKLLTVTRKNGNPMATTVQVQSGSMSGSVSVDEKLLTLAAPPAAKVVPGAPGLPGQPPVPGQNGNPQGGRIPRQRVVPPPTPGAQQPVVQPPQQQPPTQVPQATQTQSAQGNQGGQQRGPGRSSRRGN